MFNIKMAAQNWVNLVSADYSPRRASKEFWRHLSPNSESANLASLNGALFRDESGDEDLSEEDIFYDIDLDRRH